MRGITNHQLEILTGIQSVEKASGNLADFDQLLERLSWAPSKESAQFTIRAVIGKGLVEKSGLQSRRGRNRVCFKLTEAGKRVLDPRAPLPEKPLESTESFYSGSSFEPDLGLEFLEI